MPAQAFESKLLALIICLGLLVQFRPSSTADSPCPRKEDRRDVQLLRAFSPFLYLESL